MCKGSHRYIIEKSDVAHDSRAAGQYPRFLSVAEMAVDVLLFYRGFGGGAVMEQDLHGPIWIGVRVCFRHRFGLPQL